VVCSTFSSKYKCYLSFFRPHLKTNNTSLSEMWRPVPPQLVTYRAVTSVLLLLASYLPGSSQSCPAHCSCSRQAADCVGRGFTALPPTTTSTSTSTITTLLLVDNNLAQVLLYIAPKTAAVFQTHTFIIRDQANTV
jgi:hypothetical protein